jgi:hypothetical protein
MQVPAIATTVGEVQHGAQDLAVERRSDVGVCRVADTEHAADVEDLDRIADVERLRQMTGIAAQCLAVPERADEYVALVDCRHSARDELELVVARLVVEHAHGDEDALLAGDVVRDAQLLGELAVLRDRGDLVDDDTPHDPAPAARVCRAPGNDRMRA